MKLEHVRVGKVYMCGGRRMKVLEVSHQGTARILDEFWQGWKPVSDLSPIPVAAYLEDMRANYAHKFVPDPLDTPEGQQFAEDHLGVVTERPATVYERWEDVPRGALVLDCGGDVTHKRRDGTWGWWWLDMHGGYEMGAVWAADDVGGVSRTDGVHPWTLIGFVDDNVTGREVGGLVLLRGKR